MITSPYLKLRTHRKRSAELYQHLKLPQEREALEALAHVYKEDLPTGKAVEDKYREVTDGDIGVKALVETLNKATDAGLVKKHVASREDEPVLVWKPGF